MGQSLSLLRKSSYRNTFIYSDVVSFMRRNGKGFYDDWNSVDWITYVHQPYCLSQYVILTDETNSFLGFVSWAFLDEEQEIRYICGESRGDDFEQTSEEDVPWVLDFIVPFGSDHVRFTFRELRRMMSKDPALSKFKCLRGLRRRKLIKYYRIKDDT